MKPICPLLKKPCIERECKFWVHVLGKNPQTDETVNKEDCSFVWMPMLMIENSKMQRETGAAVEGLRNEVSAGANSLLFKALFSRVPALEEK